MRLLSSCPLRCPFPSPATPLNQRRAQSGATIAPGVPMENYVLGLGGTTGVLEMLLPLGGLMFAFGNKE